MPQVIFINRFYWPEEPATSQLLTDLAEGLVTKGYNISVIASRPAQQNTPTSEIHHGVNIIRVGSSRLGRSSYAGRLIDFTGFIFAVGWQLLRRTRRGDTVVYMTDPPMLGALTWPILSMRGVSFIHWVQDIYPEIAVELTKQRWLRCLQPLRNWSWRRAIACVALGRDMANVISKTGISESNIKIIPNWSPAGLAIPSKIQIDELRSRWNLGDKFVVLYSGNLGRVHDLEPILDTATSLRDQPRIIFVFVGHGAQLASLQEIVSSRGLANVKFFPPQPREQLSVTLALGDLHFVTLQERVKGYVFPSKLYGITAAHRPLIYIGPQSSELAELVGKNNLGLSFSRDQIPEIGNAIESLQRNSAAMESYSQAAHAFADQSNVALAIKTWETLLLSEPSLAAN